MHILTNLKHIPLLAFSIIILPSSVVFAQEIIITGNDSIKLHQNITDTSFIDKEVTTGYSVNRMRNMAGSVSVVEHSRLVAVPAGNVSNLLQGRASGVTVTGSGRPGETSKLRIRGFSSFLNNDPLYVVDGVPTQDISLINPNDVASVSVLKDGGAASIYGSRASNGVIIITTKRGDKGFNVTYNMSMGIQNPGKGTAGDVLDTKEYANLQWLVYKNDGTTETHPIYGSSQNPTPSIPTWAANTDWYDAITNPAGIQNHDLTLSGGSKNAKFYAGFGAFRQDGIIIYTHNTRYSVRLNSDFTLFKDRIKLGENLTVSYRDYLGVPNLSENCPIQMGPYRSQSIIPVVITQPITGITHNFVPGEWGGTGIAFRLGNSSNPVATLTRDKKDKFKDSRLTGSTFVDIKILEGLNFRSTFGGTMNDGHQTDYTIVPYEDSPNYNVPGPGTTKNDFSGSDWIWTNLLTFDKKVGYHQIFAVAGYEAVNYGIGQTISNLDSIRYTPTHILSTFVTANYAFRDKYLLSATLRRDGCSRFSESHRYGIFPSFSAGWRLSNESFLQGLKWISDLKIRGSWGKMGNQFALSPQNAVYLFGESIGGSYYDLYGTFNSSVRGYYPLRIGNPNAKWETNTTIDLGFDAGLFSNKINIVFDWYSKKTDDLLYNPPLPGTAGAGEAPYVNVASMKNSGIDIELSYQNRWNNLGLSTSVIFTTYNNKITSIADGVEYFGSGDSRIGYLVKSEAGHPLSAFYGYQVAGIFKNQIEVENAPEQESAAPGFLMFENQDTLTNEYWLWTQERYKRKSFIDSRDKTYIGNPNPKFTYGINLELSWKNFDISGFFYGSQGNDIFNYNKWWTDFWPSYQGQKSKDLLYNSWTEKNTGATVPKASNQSNFSTNTQVCSYYLEDGSYLRLKSLQVGYTLPKKMTDKIKIRSLRLYLQAVNLFTLTKYSGLDPEIGGGDLSFGIDYGNYPNAKQFIFGLSLSL